MMSRSFAACVMLVWLVTAGCTFVDVPSPAPDEGTKPTPVVEVEHPPAWAVFQVLAQWVEAKKLLSSIRLAEHVNRARENGDLSEADVSRFQTEFGEATKLDRELTAADAKKLRGLK